MENLKIIKNQDKNQLYYKTNINQLFKQEPYCFIKVNSYDEIKQCIEYAKSINKKISLRNSGHSCCLYSVLEDTVNIDLSNLNNIIDLDLEKKTITVQSSMKFMDFYREVLKYNLACPGGGCGDVAIGGLIIGGGSNFLSPGLGVAVDNVLNLKVMLENGTILNCNKIENSDLFFAMRGAGFGLAILLEVTFQLHPIEPLLYHHSINLDYSHYYENLKIIDQFSNTMDTRIYLSIDCRKNFKLMTQLNENNSTHITSPPFTCRLTYFFNGPSNEGEIHFRLLLSKLIGFDNNNNFDQDTSIKAEKVEKSFYNILNIFKFDNTALDTRSFSKCRLNTNGLQDDSTINSIKTILEAIPNNFNEMNVPDPLSQFSCILYYHGGYSNKVSADECAYHHRGSRWSIVFMSTYYKSENDHLFSNVWKSIIDKNLPNIGYYMYQNYPDYEKTIEIRENQSKYKDDHPYFGKHFEKLYSIKLKYDPLNFFNHPQSIVINN